jgi:hypothetical protein
MDAVSIENQSTQQDELADDGADRQAGRQYSREANRKESHACSEHRKPEHAAG